MQEPSSASLALSPTTQAPLLESSFETYLPLSDLEKLNSSWDNTDEDNIVEAYNNAGCPVIVYRMCMTPDRARTFYGVWFMYEDLVGPYDGWKGVQSPETPLPRPYDTRPVAGKGQGMIANRDISCGETVVRERTVLLKPAVHLHAEGLGVFESDLVDFVNMLESEYRAKLFSLTNCRPSSTPGTTILGIIRANALRCHFPQAKFSANYVGVCLDISRANHSCSPNATACFDYKTLVVELRATRDIEEGEEITISYADIFSPRAVRQDYLQTRYSFSCTCPICSVPPSAIPASDKRRKFIRISCRSLFPMWKMWFNGEGGKMSDTGRLIEHIHTLLDASQMEGLNQARAIAVRWLAYTYAGLGDKENFTKWATEAARWVPVLEDDEGGFLRANDWNAWLLDPTTMPFWGRRR